jgi:hypothetical protein
MWSVDHLVTEWQSRAGVAVFRPTLDARVAWQRHNRSAAAAGLVVNSVAPKTHACEAFHSVGAIPMALVADAPDNKGARDAKPARLQAQ